MSGQNTSEKGLPVNVDAERFVLGSILLDDNLYIQAAGVLETDDFSLEKHRRIFRRMGDLNDRGEHIDRITVANELMRNNELESCDGLSYLVSLDDGLPQIPNLDSYLKLVKDRAVLRRIIFASQHMINRAMMAEESPDEILAGAEETLLKLGEEQVKAGLLSPAQILESYEGGINAFLDPSKRVKGISTGFLKLDEMTGGLHPGDLFILAARPSMGKTAFALNIAQHIALRNKQTVAVFSLEMSKESLLTRMLCAAARVDSQRFRMGYLTPDERRKLNHSLLELAEAPLFIDDTAGLHLMDMHAKLRRLKQEHGLGSVIVDYLQLMSSRGRVENRNQEVSALSRGLKLMAKELNVPMIVLSQLSRAVETRQGDHRPVLSDLRESGCLTGDTLVTIACTGERIPIREMVGRKNACVWAIDQTTWRLQAAAVANAFSTGEKPVWRLTTRLGRTIRATANHQFLSFAGWRRLDELRPGYRLALPHRVASSPQQTMSDAELALLGHRLGDGGTLANHAIQYTTKDVSRIGAFGSPREAWRSIVIPAMQRNGMTTRELMQQFETDNGGTTLSRAGMSRERAVRIADAVDSQELRAMATGDIYWDEVLSIEPDGKEEVFDLTIPGYQNFVADDIVVHNSIEQDADVVGFIFREEVYNRDREDLRGLAELIVAKQRNGPVGTVNLVFLHSQTKFENRAEDTGELPEE